MEFESGAYGPVSDPSENEIRDGILRIDGKENSFAILSIDDETYIQTSGSPEAGFILEYQDGSLDKHYRAADLKISQDKIVSAFVSYGNQDGVWRDSLVWEKHDLSESATSVGGNGCLSLIVLGIGLICTVFLLGMYMV